MQSPRRKKSRCQHGVRISGPKISSGKYRCRKSISKNRCRYNTRISGPKVRSGPRQGKYRCRKSVSRNRCRYGVNTSGPIVKSGPRKGKYHCRKKSSQQNSSEKMSSYYPSYWYKSEQFDNILVDYPSSSRRQRSFQEKSVEYPVSYTARSKQMGVNNINTIDRNQQATPTVMVGPRRQLYVPKVEEQRSDYQPSYTARSKQMGMNNMNTVDRNQQAKPTVMVGPRRQLYVPKVEEQRGDYQPSYTARSKQMGVNNMNTVDMIDQQPKPTFQSSPIILQKSPTSTRKKDDCKVEIGTFMDILQQMIDYWNNNGSLDDSKYQMLKDLTDVDSYVALRSRCDFSQYVDLETTYNTATSILRKEKAKRTPPKSLADQLLNIFR
jgi:hypothetical protein